MSPRQTYSDPDHPGNHNPAMEEKWGAHLRSLGFRPGPAYTFGPDGVYYGFCADGIEKQYPAKRSSDIMLIVVGPMATTPFEYAKMVSARYDVYERGHLPPEEGAVDDIKRLVEARGFWTIWLRDCYAETNHQDSPKPSKPELKVVGDGET